MEAKWTESGNCLRTVLEFQDFVQAIAFMQDVALVAESHHHHPWWSNMYNKVEIKLQTHDAGYIISNKDRLLAQAIDIVLKKY